ncbi:MAG: nuclease [Parvibaculum sp.]
MSACFAAFQRFFGFLGLAALFGAVAPSAIAGDVIAGPVSAAVVRVVDGDTIEVRARIWIGQDVRVLVRLDGIDTPELRGKCDEEKVRARAARDHLAPITGGEVALTGIYEGKFAGRVVANVTHEAMGDLSLSLLEANLARPYSGGKRLPWCSAQTALR